MYWDMYDLTMHAQKHATQFWKVAKPTQIRYRHTAENDCETV